jgi:hypothetical protein
MGGRRPAARGQAYWVPTVSVRDVFLTSKRLHNVHYSPIGDFIADQVWLR